MSAGYNVTMSQGERTNIKYKDTVFRMLFSDKERLLSLYNAMSPKHCDNIDELKVVTLESAIYMEAKNDIAFIIDTDIHLWEHQSTLNSNMPLRFLQYITAEYQRLTSKRSLYSRKIVKLPQPHFVVFYNGIEDSPDHNVLKLSDAFQVKTEDAALELVADVYNINAGHNCAVQETCEALKGYAEFVSRIRENQKVMPLSQAVNKAVNDCIKDGILADFLRDNKAEVIGMSIFEFDREEHERIIRTEEYEEGEAAGEARGEYNKAVATARKALDRNIPRDVIADITGLTLEEVAAL